jgi:glycosyltransferase involved in cell wall biosynthesis
VHIHQAYTRCSEVGLLVARQQKKPICVTDHQGNSSDLGREVGSLELADRIIAYSDFGASLTARSRVPVVVINGGVDAGLFRPPAGRPVRDRVVYVGRLLPHKGIDRLIAALPPELPLTVCGRPGRADYLAYLHALAAGKTVEFIHGADDRTVRDLYGRAWACVLPSVYNDCYGVAHTAPELRGFTLLEAMACGTPAVCSRVSAMPEFVLDGETGFIFDHPEELAIRLRGLANDPDLVEHLGRRARAVVESEYALEVAGRRLLAVYDDLLAGRAEVAA